MAANNNLRNTDDSIDDSIDNLTLSSSCYKLMINNGSLESSINNITESIINNKEDIKKNKFTISSIENIQEKILRDLIEEFVNQLYFKRQNELYIFEKFKPDWLRKFIKIKNVDSKDLLGMMLKHKLNNDYFTSYIGYFYQYGIGTEVDKYRSLSYYFQATNLYSTNQLENNSLEVINQSIGQCFLAIFYKKGIIVSKDVRMMIEFGYEIGKNERRAFEWFLKSAEKGNSDVQYWVAICYSNGIGIEEDVYKAFESFCDQQKVEIIMRSITSQCVIMMVLALKRMNKRH